MPEKFIVSDESTRLPEQEVQTNAFTLIRDFRTVIGQIKDSGMMAKPLWYGATHAQLHDFDTSPSTIHLKGGESIWELRYVPERDAHEFSAEVNTPRQDKRITLRSKRFEEQPSEPTPHVGFYAATRECITVQVYNREAFDEGQKLLAQLKAFGQALPVFNQ